MYFLQGIFFHLRYHLKRALFRLKHHEFSSFSLRGQLHRLEDTKRNVLDLADFRIKSVKEVFEWVGFLGLIDLLITRIHFRSSQTPVSLKITTVASMIRETSAITPTNLLKKDLTFKTHFMRIFAAVKASLVWHYVTDESEQTLI